MKKILLGIFLLTVTVLVAENMKHWKASLAKLSTKERAIIVDKGTERPYTGKYLSNKEAGIYRCKVCDTPLYSSTDKFDSHCGWPSFDDEIKGAIKHKKDADGKRTEILCAKCGGHLGHVFVGEGLTAKNTRHCVNSLSLNFQKKKQIETQTKYKKAYFAGGCFWGVEYYLESIKGVKEATSGYMGGHTKNPTYKEISYKKTGHLETVEVIYDPSVVSYEALAKIFFEIHDPTQTNGQGPDIGSQYYSAVFVNNQKEYQLIAKLIGLLEEKRLKVATKIIKDKHFYKAEAYHQDYYQHKGTKPYCHGYKKKF